MENNQPDQISLNYRKRVQENSSHVIENEPFYAGNIRSSV